MSELDALDRLIHEPARLLIMTTLASCASADFMFLRRMTGLTNGNLSSHLTKLEDAGLVTVIKAFVDRKPNTRVSITEEGRRAIESHWSALARIRRSAQSGAVGSGLKPRPRRVNFIRVEADG